MAKKWEEIKNFYSLKKTQNANPSTQGLTRKGSIFCNVHHGILQKISETRN